MQQPNIFSYSFSANEKDKKPRPERKPQPRKKIISYIDIKYNDKAENDKREELDKDIVF